MVNIDKYLDLLQSELVVALGCTEPIAIALCAAKAREILGQIPSELDVYCSNNIIKNAHGVTIPNSKGLKGVDFAAALGALGGDATKELEVLSGLTSEDIGKACLLIKQGKVKTHFQKDTEKLYIRCVLKSDQDMAEVVISEKHTNFSVLKKNGIDLLSSSKGFPNNSGISEDTYQLSVDDIYEFANIVDLGNNNELVDLLNKQIDFNFNIASVGVAEDWGNQIGKTLLTLSNNDSSIEASAWATAGTDARMGGCPLPVVINSGSGNQGLTVSVPVIVIARNRGYSHEKLLRALLIANLVSIHTKKNIGYLSAFCGAVTAAAGAGAGIAYLFDMSLNQINMVITNTLVASIGILCDGAKPSCSLKVHSSLSSAMLAIEMAKNQNVIDPGDGFVGDTIEKTIENIGRIAREGMNQADVEILNVIIKNDKPTDC